LQINANQINFRKLHKSAAEMREDEARDLYPPRFKLKINCLNSCYQLNLRYDVCVVQKEAADINLQLNIFIDGPQNSQGNITCMVTLYQIQNNPAVKSVQPPRRSL